MQTYMNYVKNVSGVLVLACATIHHSRLPLPPQELLLFLFVFRSFFPSALLKEDNLIAVSVDASANDYGVTTAIAVLCRVVCRNPFSHSWFLPPPACLPYCFVLFAYHFYLILCESLFRVRSLFTFYASHVITNVLFKCKMNCPLPQRMCGSFNNGCQVKVKNVIFHFHKIFTMFPPPYLPFTLTSYAPLFELSLILAPFAYSFLFASILNVFAQCQHILSPRQMEIYC